MATIQFDPIGKFKYTKNDCGQYHSYNDEPAIEYLDGSAKLWYKNGLIHRDCVSIKKIIIRGEEKEQKDINKEKPAIIYQRNDSHYNSQSGYITKKSSKEWYEMGIKLRTIHSM
jgi:hypothetical protein